MIKSNLLQKGTVSYAVFFYLFVSIGSLLSIVFSLRGGRYLSSVYTLGLLLVISAIGFTLLRHNYLKTDVRARSAEGDSESKSETSVANRAQSLPFSGDFWEVTYNCYVDQPEFKRAEIALYIIGISLLTTVTFLS